MATKEQEAYLRSLEEEKSEDARARAARFGRFTRRAQVVAPSGGLSVTVVRAAGQGNPVNAGPINFTVTFSKPVTGFTNSDVSFAGSTVGGTLAAAVTGAGPYNIAVTGMTGVGNVVVSIPAGAATDAAGALTPISNSASVIFNAVGPTVTVNQAAGQQDPTSLGPINFTVVFSASVTGFTSSDVTFTGSTATGTLVAAVTGSGATYNVAVTGMTGAGTVVVNVPASVATDLAGNANQASSAGGAAAAFGSQGTYLAYGVHVGGSTLVAPAGITNGDLLVAHLLVGSGLDPNTPVPPAGWNTLTGSPTSINDGSFFGKYNVFYKIAAGEAGNYTFTHPDYSSCGVITRYTGVNGTTPLDPVPTVNTGTGSTTTALGFTTTDNNTFVVFTAHDWGDTANNLTPPPGSTPTFTERVDQPLIYIADGALAAAGATGNKAMTNNSTGAHPWSAFLIGIKSAGGSASDNTVTFNTATISHGEQLTVNDVGPWTLQSVAKGSESLDTVAVPGRGFWLMDTPSEWAPTGTYVLNNTPSNKGGIVPAGGLTIDGFFVPAGTVVCQFRNLSGTDFSAQGQGGSYLFRGCRFRQNGVGDPSQFNDFTSTYTNALHYCDMGGLSAANADADAPFWKSIGGQNHRVLRCYMTFQKVALQPNTPNFVIAENYIDKITFFWGSAGPPAGGGPNHTAAIGCEGGGTGFRFYRNRIVIPSPDDAGRVIENGATVAMEGTNGQTYTDCQVTDNYVAGANYSFLLFGERAGQTNLVFTGNKITTQWWTNSGISGPIQAGPFPVPWGTNGNVQSNNTWADDYGTGGNGTGTPLSSRQFPTGNGPRKGTTFL